MDEAGIRTALFRLFEERQAWRMKELLGRTGQAEADVKPVLRAIADNQMMGGSCVCVMGWIEMGA